VQETHWAHRRGPLAAGLDNLLADRDFEACHLAAFPARFEHFTFPSEPPAAAGPHFSLTVFAY
jgi:hypothetical protein